MAVSKGQLETVMNKNTDLTQQIILKSFQDDNLISWIEAYLQTCRATNLTRRTIEDYKEKLKPFLNYCLGLAINDLNQINPTTIRQYLLFLQEKGHNQGGVHCHFRVLRAFLKWYSGEEDDFINPLNKVKSPRLNVLPLDPVSLDDINALLSTCKSSKFTDHRDKAIILTLMDSGLRALELLNLNLEDCNFITGEILVRQGKGKKPRYTYVGRVTRKAIRSYLKVRNNTSKALFIRIDREGRLGYDALRTIFVRRAKLAGLQKAPSPHSFRRQFALSCLKNHMDINILAKLMGHTSLAVLQRYLKISSVDTEEAYKLNSPVDRLMNY